MTLRCARRLAFYFGLSQRCLPLPPSLSFLRVSFHHIRLSLFPSCRACFLRVVRRPASDGSAVSDKRNGLIAVRSLMKFHSIGRRFAFYAEFLCTRVSFRGVIIRSSPMWADHTTARGFSAARITSQPAEFDPVATLCIIKCCCKNSASEAITFSGERPAETGSRN